MSVVLTVVPTAGEADMIAALLRAEGIPCAYPETSRWSEGGLGTPGGTPGYEIRVAEADYDRARELIEAGE